MTFLASRLSRTTKSTTAARYSNSEKQSFEVNAFKARISIGVSRLHSRLLLRSEVGGVSCDAASSI